jgi:hypothetical protein
MKLLTIDIVAEILLQHSMTRKLTILALAYVLPTLALLTGGSLARADHAIGPNPPYRWWKGNLHTHSLWSDGNDFPEMIAQWYRDHGYHFLALSDHNVLSQGVKWIKATELDKRKAPLGLEKYLARFGPHWVETRRHQDSGALEVRLKPLDEFRHLVEERGRFLMIPSEEISDKVGKLPLHLNAANLRDLIEPLGGKTIREAIENNLRAVEEQSRKTGRETLLHLNHPNFHWAVTAEDLAAVIRERFFEVYNGHTGVRNLGDSHHAGTEEIWDVANTLRLARLDAPPLFGVATDDSHDYDGRGPQRPGRGWVMVRATHLTPESLIRAMKAGDFYASSGVVLHDFRYDQATRRLSIQIVAECGVEYTTRFIGTPRGTPLDARDRVNDKGEPLVTTKKYAHQVGTTFSVVKGARPVYQLTGNELYVRAIVTSSKPHSNPSHKGQWEQAWTQPVGWLVPDLSPSRERR